MGSRFTRTSPIPLYYQFAEWIRQQIRDGELEPGDRLPGERELSEEAGMSRMTVRHALSYLVREGTLVVRRGLGTFVAEPKLTYDALHLLSFTEHMLHEGLEAASRVLQHARVQAPPRVAAALQLTSDAPVVKFVRLRFSRDVALLLETIFLPAELCPGLEHEDLSDKSLYSVLEHRYDLALKRAAQTLEATVANANERRLFEVKAGTSMILVEGLTYLESGRPVELFKAVYRGDRFKFRVESERHLWVQEAARGPHLSVVLT
jgi:GntR family transcriptional regulator